MMNRRDLRCLMGILALALATGAVAEPWRWRGELDDAGRPASGTYAFRIAVFDAEVGGREIAPRVTVTNVPVSDGRFDAEVDLDVPLAHFESLWLGVEVAGLEGRFEALPGRQRVAPKAVHGGTCWDTRGNRGTNPAVDFLGTTDAQPLLLRVANAEAGRIEAESLSIGVFWGFAHDIDRTAGSVAGLTIAGGLDNKISGGFNAIGGGFGNTAAGNGSTVGGGTSNTAGDPATYRGIAATVPGGRLNVAGGDYSFAAGLRARVRNVSQTTDTGSCDTSGTCGDEGTFVWADATNVDFTSSNPNQFLVRAGGGLGVNTSAIGGADDMVLATRATATDPDADLVLRARGGSIGRIYQDDQSGGFVIETGNDRYGVGATPDAARYINTGSGAFLSTGGTWTNASSRHLKHAFAAVDPAQVLARVMELPIARWRYRSETQVEHLGPMAEDFAAAFALGGDDAHIATVDADGVALAAIQGLNAKLEAENAALRRRLSQIEGAVRDLQEDRAAPR